MFLHFFTVRWCSDFILSEWGIDSRFFILWLNGLIILWVKVLKIGKCVTAMFSWSFISSLESFSLPTRSLAGTFTKNWLENQTKTKYPTKTQKYKSLYTEMLYANRQPLAFSKSHLSYRWAEGTCMPFSY